MHGTLHLARYPDCTWLDALRLRQYAFSRLCLGSGLPQEVLSTPS